MRDPAAAGFAALAARDWEQARSLLEQTSSDARSQSPEVLDALADACWWLGDVDAALAARERATGAWRRCGELDRAVRGAVWIAIEYASSLANAPASQGWVARAETMASDPHAPATAAGWLALGRATLVGDPAAQIDAAESALNVAREHGDDELEVLALARLGWATVATGSIDSGVVHFDEAMAVATAADFEHLSALGDLCCQLALATEMTGERDRFATWLEVVRHVNSEYRYPPLAGFCATCCAELHSIDGNWEAAEAHLRHGIDELRGTGYRARCGPPVAKLAELLVLQGRVEEASDVLADDDSDSTLVARARLALARGEPGAARTLADRCARRIGDNLRAVNALSVAGEAAIAKRDRDGAAAICERIGAIASRTSNRRAAGAAALLEGQLLLDAGELEAAAAAFERALDHYAGLNGLLEAASAHLGLAEAARDRRPEVARVEAKTALACFEAAGATRRADTARALLRALGDRSPVGRKGRGLLTDRELEILRLLARGLTNAEIAERLYISVKTAGNHVSNILTKVGVRSRTEAAAFVALHPEILSRS